MCTAVVVAMFPLFSAMAPTMGRDAMSTLVQLAVIAIPLSGLALTIALPWIVAPMTRWWTSALPVRSAPWHLARSTVVARSDRLVRSIVPVMFTVGLLFGLMCIGDTLVATLDRLGQEPLEGTSTFSTLSVIGLPLAIAVAGSVGNLVMMSHQRNADLAFAGVVGATPRQQLLVPVFEALMLTVTASILGLVMALGGACLLRYGLGILLPHAQLSVPWALLGWTVLGCLVVVTSATVLPVLRSLQHTAPRVIAHHVAA